MCTCAHFHTRGAVSADKDRHGDGQDGRPTGLSTSRAFYSATTSLPSEDLLCLLSPYPHKLPGDPYLYAVGPD
ncbi:hypothetical protein ANTQUA_LOCUS10113 [Anthophora quadrimaculata]